MLQYKWEITPRINQLLIELEGAKLLFTNLPTHPHLEENLRQSALLKSAVYSARVEGFADTIISPKKESRNLLTAYRFLYSPRSPRKLTLSLIRRLHRLGLRGLSSKIGYWRTEPWAIFNQAGMAIYLAPPHFEVPQLMDEYTDLVNRLSDHPAVVAAVAQFIFEKIHPFADGNGRVGRLISAFILQKNNYGFRGLTPFEEYIDRHREIYYSSLEPSLDCTPFVEFFLEALVSQSKLIFERFSGEYQEKPEDSLLPRRREILEIIRDHPHCTFDLLHRRFASINIKTLHYDLNQLMKKGFVRKLGVTNKAVYTSVNEK